MPLKITVAHAIQTVHFPDKVLMEMLRIGKESIVTFPNFGHWRCRIYLTFQGRMPVSRFLPHGWYDTPNIHFCTVKDFEKLCSERDIQIKDKSMIAGGKLWSLLAATFFSGFLAFSLPHHCELVSKNALMNVPSYYLTTFHV